MGQRVQHLLAGQPVQLGLVGPEGKACMAAATLAGSLVVVGLEHRLGQGHPLCLVGRSCLELLAGQEGRASSSQSR
jgi:hypothetical protein